MSLSKSVSCVLPTISERILWILKVSEALKVAGTDGAAWNQRRASDWAVAPVWTMIMHLRVFVDSRAEFFGFACECDSGLALGELEGLGSEDIGELQVGDCIVLLRSHLCDI